MNTEGVSKQIVNKQIMDKRTGDKKILNKQKGLDCILIFLLCFLPRICMALQSMPVAYISDEVSALHIAAKVAGYDWSDVVSHAGYYGIGFLWIFWPLFKAGLPAVLIYKIILASLAAVNALTGLVYYLTMTRFFQIRGRLIKILAASVCGNGVFLYVVAMSARNEEILALLVSIIVYLLCKIIEEGRFRDEVVLICLMVYALTCHTRAVALILTVLVIGIIYRLYYQKRLLHIQTYLICIGGMLVVNAFLGSYRSGIWHGGTVRNSSVASGVSGSLTRLISDGELLEKLKVWVKIVVGQIYTATTITGGLFLIVTSLCLICIVKAVYNDKFVNNKRNDCEIEQAYSKEINCEKKITENNRSFNVSVPFLPEKRMVLSVFSLTLVYMTIFTMGLTWLSGVYSSITEYGTSQFVSSYRAFSYTRYFGVYVPSLFMIGFCIEETDHRSVKLGSILAVSIYVILSALWFLYIVVFFVSKKRVYYYLLAGFFTEGQAKMSNWILAGVLGTVLLVSVLALIGRKRTGAACALCLTLLIAEQLCSFQYSTLGSQETNYNKANAGYDLITEMKDILDQDIYVCDLSSRTDHQIYYLYQLLNYTYHIIPEMPQNTEEDFILFTNKPAEELSDAENIFCWKLDKNEYVYTNVETYQNAIGELGYQQYFQS